MTSPSNQGGKTMSAAPASVSPLPNLHGHMPALDGVRGLAILMVLLGEEGAAHTLAIPGTPDMIAR